MREKIIPQFISRDQFLNNRQSSLGGGVLTGVKFSWFINLKILFQLKICSQPGRSLSGVNVPSPTSSSFQLT